MVNMIKADIKRILHSKSIWVMPIIILLMVSLVSGLFAGLKYVMSLDLSAVIGDSMDSLAALGTIANTGYEMTMINLQSDTLIYVFLVILLSVSAFDFSSGTVKNLLSIGRTKERIYYSKLITSCIWGVVGVITYSIISTLMGYLFFGDMITGNEFIEILFITLKQIPIYLSVLITGHMFVFMTQKIAFSMMLYVGSFMLFETVIPLLDMILDLPIKISLLMPLYQLIEMTKNEIELSAYLTVYISCTIYCVTSAICGYYTFKRSELNSTTHAQRLRRLKWRIEEKVSIPC